MAAAPTTARTLPRPHPDDETSAERSVRTPGVCADALAPPGQLVLAGARGQLGLDGQVYAVADVDLPRFSAGTGGQGREATGYLGRDTTFCTATRDDADRDVRAADRDVPLAPRHGTQLELDPALFEGTSQLTLWGRLEVQQGLLRGRTESDRDAKCQRTRFSTDGEVVVHRSSSGNWRIENVIACDCYTCAACGPRRARRVTSKLAVAMRRHHDADIAHDTAMLTLAPPHSAEDSQTVTVARTYEARAVFRRSREWRAFARQWGIVGAVRCLDATHGGANGLHAHFHEALFMTSAMCLTTWQPDEAHGTLASELRAEERAAGDVAGAIARACVSYDTSELRGYQSLLDTFQPLRMQSRGWRDAYLAHVLKQSGLVDAWLRACREVGIVVENERAFRTYAIRLSPSEEASTYFLKWGLADEVGAPTAKRNSHLRLLDIAGAGGDVGEVAGELYRAFREAIAGRAWVTGLADICRRYKVLDEDGDALLSEIAERRRELMRRAGTPLLEVRELHLQIWPHLFPAATRIGWEKVFAFVDDASGRIADHAELQREVAAFLWRNLAGDYVAAYRRRGIVEGERAPPSVRGSPPDGTALVERT